VAEQTFSCAYSAQTVTGFVFTIFTGAISTRVKSQISLKVREDRRHFLESCYNVLLTSKNPVSKYRNFHIFSSQPGN
jgi:hypothetical protein